MAKHKGKAKSKTIDKTKDDVLLDVENGDDGAPSAISQADYKKSLRALQIELVKLQKHIIAANTRLLVVFEGRDAAGKDGTIKRIVQHLSPRETRVVALPKPSDREQTQWYFQRFVNHLPAADEFVLFNRSWYNRAGVERVMGFCTEAEYDSFMVQVIAFEEMLVQSGILLFKYYLDITREEQRKRLEDRRRDPLKQWKISPIDAAALKHWDAYSQARNEMLLRSNHEAAPWHVVDANDKRAARLNTMRDILSRIDYEGRNKALLKTNPRIVFPFKPECLVSGLIAR